MRKKNAQILIVDDDVDIVLSAKIWLKKFFTTIKTSNKPKEIPAALVEENIDVVLLDMNFRKGFENGQDGLYWMKQIQELSPKTSIILMTAYGEIELAVEALKLGASDFILKPWNNEKLYASVNLAVELARKNNKINQWESIQKQQSNYILESKCSLVQNLLEMVNKIAPTEANVLLLGENGTGKYVLAEQIHQKSERARQPFIHIDLGSLPENLFESELFGYKKGAFTDATSDTAGKIEIADGGTVFLDEIGNLSTYLQSKLLTLIQNKKISRIGETKQRNLDVRFIFATNENLQQKINDNTFRKDLYFRINTVELTLAPLRERLKDIELFAQHFINKYQNKYHKIFSLTNENISELKNYSWPGNIRELEHVIERSVILSDNNALRLSLPKNRENEDYITNNQLNMKHMEEKLIQLALKKHQGNISLAAQELGLSRASLYRRMEKFKI